MAPEFKDKAFKKVPDYDFSSHQYDSIFSKDPADKEFFKERV